MYKLYCNDCKKHVRHEFKGHKYVIDPDDGLQHNVEKWECTGCKRIWLY